MFLYALLLQIAFLIVSFASMASDGADSMQFRTYFSTFEEAESAMHSTAKKSNGLLKKSGGSKTISSKARNREPLKVRHVSNVERTMVNSKLWIDPEVVGTWRHNYCCHRHARLKSAGGKKVRSVRNYDLGCKYKASITAIPVRDGVRYGTDLTKTPTYVHELWVRFHKDEETQKIPYATGHNHDTSEQEEALMFAHQNKQLSAEEKDIIESGLAYKASPETILKNMGGPFALDGRYRTTKAIGNYIANLKKKAQRDLPSGTTEVDEMIAALVGLGCKFSFYSKKEEGDDLSDEPDFTENDFQNGKQSIRVDRMAGKDLGSFHWALPGASIVGRVYGDIVGLDSTHNTNAARLYLYFSMVRDAEGNAHIITCSLFSSENCDSVAASLRFQKRAGLLSHDVVIIDKDNVELAALRKEAPEAYILLCRFHVIKYFVQRMAPMYLPVHKRDAACGLWRKMVYARTEIEFLKYFEILTIYVAEVQPIDAERYKLTPPTLIDAIVKNWLPCLGSWSLLSQQWYTTLERLTNNSSERKHGVVKQSGLGLRTTLPNLIMLLYDRVLTDLHKLFEKTGTRMLTDEHPESLGVPIFPRDKDVSGWLCEYAEKHFKKAYKHALTHTYEVQTIIIEPSSDSPEYVVTLTIHGLTCTSSEQSITLAVPYNAIDNETLSNNVLIFARLDPRVIRVMTCSCSEYMTFFPSLCRHCLWSIIFTADLKVVPEGRLPVHHQLFPQRDLSRFNFRLAKEAIQSISAATVDQPVVTTGINTIVSAMPANATSDALIGKYMPEAHEVSRILCALSDPERSENFDEHVWNASRRACRWIVEFVHLLVGELLVRGKILPHNCLVSIVRKCEEVCWDVLPEPENVYGQEGILQLFVPHMKFFARGIACVADTSSRGLHAGERGKTAAAWASTLVSRIAHDTYKGHLPVGEDEEYFRASSDHAKHAVGQPLLQPIGLRVDGQVQARNTRRAEKRRREQEQVQRQLIAAEEAVEAARLSNNLHS